MADVEFIAGKLNQHRQRATYGAVADIVGGSSRGLMAGKVRSQLFSWIVSKDSGRPTGYAPAEIHPDCLHQILERRGEVISDGPALLAWLKKH
jgi:hypothetical protein